MLPRTFTNQWKNSCMDAYTLFKWSKHLHTLLQFTNSCSLPCETPLTPDQLKHIDNIYIVTVKLITAGLRSVIEESRVWSSAVCDLAFSCSDVTQNIKKALLSDRLSFVHTDQGRKAGRSSSKATGPALLLDGSLVQAPSEGLRMILSYCHKQNQS